MTMTGTLGGIGNVVQMHNHGDTKFRMPYGRQWLEIEPGQTFMCTQEIAAHFLGRWWTDNTDPKYRERAAEVHRLHTLYGAYEDMVMWEQNRPRVGLFAPNGEPIVTVVDDPHGLHARPVGLIANSSVAEQVQFMQAQLAQLLQQQNNREGMPPPIDASLRPPPPPPHTPGPLLVPSPGGNVRVTSPSVLQPTPSANPAPTATTEFDPAYLADLHSTMPEHDESAIMDDIEGDAIGTRLEPDAREVPLPQEVAAAAEAGPPIDNPPVMKTGRSAVRTRS